MEDKRIPFTGNIQDPVVFHVLEYSWIVAGNKSILHSFSFKNWEGSYLLKKLSLLVLGFEIINQATSKFSTHFHLSLYLEGDTSLLLTENIAGQWLWDYWWQSLDSE